MPDPLAPTAPPQTSTEKASDIPASPGLGSPPPVVAGSALESDFLRTRQRLADLQALLADRFDRRAWHEYLRLRRTPARPIDA